MGYYLGLSSPTIDTLSLTKLFQRHLGTENYRSQVGKSLICVAAVFMACYLR